MSSDRVAFHLLHNDHEITAFYVNMSTIRASHKLHRHWPSCAVLIQMQFSKTIFERLNVCHAKDVSNQHDQTLPDIERRLASDSKEFSCQLLTGIFSSFSISSHDLFIAQIFTLKPPSSACDSYEWLTHFQ
jgi:hypothetical protein